MRIKRGFLFFAWLSLKRAVSVLWLYFFGALLGIWLYWTAESLSGAFCLWVLVSFGSLFLISIVDGSRLWLVARRYRGFSRYQATITRDGVDHQIVLTLPDSLDGLPIAEQIKVFHAQIKGQI